MWQDVIPMVKRVLPFLKLLIYSYYPRKLDTPNVFCWPKNATMLHSPPIDTFMAGRVFWALSAND